MADVANISYWEKRWQEGFTPWHNSGIHECLEQHYQKLMPSSCQTSKARVFVPLCGKSLDMIWLEEKGFQVIGLEGYESAIQAFYQENNIEYEVKTNLRQVRSYHGLGKDITIYAMDIFNVTGVNELGGGYFDAIWDRGSLSAIGLYADNRGQRYADILTGLLKPSGRIMVESHTFDEDHFPGPDHPFPSHIPETLLNEMFGDKFDISTVEVKNFPHVERAYNLMQLK